MLQNFLQRGKENNMKTTDHLVSFDKGVRFACNIVIEYATKQEITKEDLVQLCTVLKQRIDKDIIKCKLN